MIKIRPALYRGIISGVVRKITHSHRCQEQLAGNKQQQKNMEIKVHKLTQIHEKTSANRPKNEKKR